jgi:hypothetical protein
MSRYQAHASSLVRGTAIVILACLVPSAAVCESGAPPANLARNPSFEQAAANSALPAEWHGTPQVYSLDTAVARSGTASLKYVNRDPQRYVLCTQEAPVQAGWKCRVSAWIKTQDLAGDESGATICLEWQGQDGKWLGGVYPTGIKGTREWTRVEAITRLPDDAASCHVTCYVRKEMTGTAWFDDVEVVRIAEGHVVFQLPATPKAIRVLGEDRALEPRGATLRILMPRLAVQCYEIEFADR